MDPPVDQFWTDALVIRSGPRRDGMPDEADSSKRHSAGALMGSSSMMDLSELPNGITSRRREHRRSESRVWRPRDAASTQRPSWASVGHHAIVPWRSTGRFDGENTIRMVAESEGWAEYDAENDSIWLPLESDLVPLLQNEPSGEEDDAVIYSDDFFTSPKVRIDEPPMPARDPPLPPSSSDRHDSHTESISRHVEKEAHSSAGKVKGKGKEVVPPKPSRKQSRFMEYVDENREALRKLGIPYEAERRGRLSGWFNSLTRQK